MPSHKRQVIAYLSLCFCSLHRNSGRSSLYEYHHDHSWSLCSGGTDHCDDFDDMYNCLLLHDEEEKEHQKKAWSFNFNHSISFGVSTSVIYYCIPYSTIIMAIRGAVVSRITVTEFFHRIFFEGVAIVTPTYCVHVGLLQWLPSVLKQQWFMYSIIPEHLDSYREPRNFLSPRKNSM